MNSFRKKIVINDDDTELIESNQEFINFIDKQFENFKLHKKDLEKKYKSIINENKKNFKNEKDLDYIKVNYSNEDLERRSPLGILNAPWGSGKTYFIEKTLENLIRKKIKSNQFKFYVKFDSWKLLHSKNLPLQLILELKNFLENKVVDNESKKRNLNSFFLYIINNCFISSFNNFTNFSIEKVKTKNQIIKREIDDYNKNKKKYLGIHFDKILKEPVLVFIDNIERLMNGSWEVMKLISILSEIKNICFILPMNLKAFPKNEEKFIEYPIEKYVDFKIVDLEQNFIPFLKQYGFENRLGDFNDFFKETIDGQTISIRNLKKNLLLHKRDLEKIKSYYEKVYFLKNNIWGSDDSLKKFIKKDIEKFYPKFSDLVDDFDKLKKYLLGWVKKIKDFNDTLEKGVVVKELNIEEELNIDDLFYVFSKKELIVDFINKSFEFIISAHNIFDKEIKNEKKKIEAKNKGLNKNLNDIDSYEKKLKREKEKANENKDGTKISSLNSNIAELKKIVNDLENEIYSSREVQEKLENFINELNDDYGENLELINDKKEEFITKLFYFIENSDSLFKEKDFNSDSSIDIDDYNEETEDTENEFVIDLVDLILDYLNKKNS